MAVFDSTAATMKRFRLSLVTAQRELRLHLPEPAPPAGSKPPASTWVGCRANAARYQAFLYGDRDLYRPGDTIQTNTVVRTEGLAGPARGFAGQNPPAAAHRQGV